MNEINEIIGQIIDHYGDYIEAEEYDRTAQKYMEEAVELQKLGDVIGASARAVQLCYRLVGSGCPRETIERNLFGSSKYDAIHGISDMDSVYELARVYAGNLFSSDSHDEAMRITRKGVADDVELADSMRSIGANVASVILSSLENGKCSEKDAEIIANKLREIQRYSDLLFYEGENLDFANSQKNMDDALTFGGVPVYLSLMWVDVLLAVNLGRVPLEVIDRLNMFVDDLPSEAKGWFPSLGELVHHDDDPPTTEPDSIDIDNFDVYELFGGHDDAVTHLDNILKRLFGEESQEDEDE